MQTDERYGLEAEPKKKKAKKPLVLRESADPVRSDSTSRKGAGRPPRRVGNKPTPLRDDPREPSALDDFFGAARDEAPNAVNSGVTSAMVNAFVQDAIARNKPTERNAFIRKPVDPRHPPLVLESMRNPEPEAGILDAARDVRDDPRRLLPGSGGWAAGAGAAAPHLAASIADPIGGVVGAAALKGAGAVTKNFGKRLMKVPIPEGAGAAARHLIADESGQAMPGWGPLAAKAALDAADDAFEAGGQRLAAGAENAFNRGLNVANAGAARIAPTATTIGDVLHKPKVWAEDAATAIANKIDLPGRTGKNLDQWYESAKHAPAATRSPVANKILDETRRIFISDFGFTPEMHEIKEAGRVFGNNVARPLEDLALDLNKTRTGDELHDAHFLATEGMTRDGAYPNPQIQGDASRIKIASRAADQMLEEIGALPPGMTAEFDGTHLPRAYAKHWNVEGRMDRFATSSISENWQHLKSSLTDNRIEGYYRRGVDEVQPDGSVVRRDWTRQERDAWGEIFNAPSALQRKANKARHEGTNAHILDAYAQPDRGDAKGAFTVDVPTPGYTRMGTATAGESGIPRYGKLAGKYVRDDVAFTIKNMNTLTPFINKLNKVSLNNLWKKVVTIGNFPGYFVNNFFQNPLILERTGGSMFDMPQAWDDLAKNTIDVQRMEEAGVIRNGVLARELGSQMKHFNATLSSPYQHTGFSIPKQIFRGMNALKKYENNGYKLAGASDDLYRVALMNGLMKREGKTFAEAAEIAKNAFYDSNAITAPGAQVASVIAPFAKVVWWAADNEAKAWTQNPGKAAYVDMLTTAMPIAMNYALGKEWSQQKAEHEALPDNVKGHNNNFPLPGGGYLDTSNWNQRNTLKPAPGTALQMNIPLVSNVTGPVGYPRGLMPGGPLALGAQAMLGKDWFTDKDIVEYDRDGNYIRGGLGEFAWRNTVPGIARNGSAIVAGMTDEDSSFADAVTGLMRRLGIKIKEPDIPGAMKRNERERSSNLSKARKRGATEAELEQIEQDSQERYRTLTQQ